jgi:hypothetical protein
MDADTIMLSSEAGTRQAGDPHPSLTQRRYGYPHRLGGRIALVAAGLSLLLSACGGGGGSHDAHATTTAPSSSSPPSAAVLARPQVIAAYEAMWADMAAAGQTADYQSPLLPQHAAGAALSTLVRGLYAYRQKGLVIKGGPVTHPQVTSLTPPADPTQAAILDCFDDTHWLVYKASGGLENNVPGGHRKVTAVVQDMNGVWKVTQLDTGAEGTC